LGIEVGCEQNGLTKFITVKNNMIFNNRGSGLYVGGWTTLTTGEVLFSTFRNNTFFQNNSNMTSAGEISISKASGCIFEDNLLYTNGSNVLLKADNILPQADNLINYNCWYTPSGDDSDIVVHWALMSFSSFNAYKSFTSQESNSIYGNPVFTNPNLPSPSLQLQNTSSCIDHGNPELNIAAEETDFSGNPRVINGIVDIGAQEVTEVLATSDFNDKDLIRIFPNPLSDIATVTTSIEMNSATFELYDVSGRIVRQMRNITGNAFIIARENLVPGIYLYKMRNEGKELSTGKILVR
jgi:hypothetical protein